MSKKTISAAAMPRKPRKAVKRAKPRKAARSRGKECIVDAVRPDCPVHPLSNAAMAFSTCGFLRRILQEDDPLDWVVATAVLVCAHRTGLADVAMHVAECLDDLRSTVVDPEQPSELTSHVHRIAEACGMTYEDTVRAGWALKKLGVSAGEAAFIYREVAGVVRDADGAGDAPKGQADRLLN